MSPLEFNKFCKSLPHTTYVMQWGGADVWKVGGKVFAINFPSGDTYSGITFKTSPMSYELLKTQKGLRPAPYFASRDIKWIQRVSDESMDDDALKAYLHESYRLVLAGLSKKKRSELV